MLFVLQTNVFFFSTPTLLCAGHLKRFMRGIIEMMEVMKSGPPTPSTVSLQSSVSAKLNGVAPPLSVPPPQQYAADEPGKDDIIAAPPTFDEVVTPTEKKLSRGVSDEAFQPPVEKPKGMGKRTFTKMRSLLEIQLAGGTVDLPDGDTEDTANGGTGQSDTAGYLFKEFLLYSCGYSH